MRNLAKELGWSRSHCKMSAKVENPKVCFPRKFLLANPVSGQDRTSVYRGIVLKAPRRFHPAEDFDFWLRDKLFSRLASFLHVRCTRRPRLGRTWCCCRWTWWLRLWSFGGPLVEDLAYPKRNSLWSSLFSELVIHTKGSQHKVIKYFLFAMTCKLNFMNIYWWRKDFPKTSYLQKFSILKTIILLQLILRLIFEFMKK